MKFHEVLGGNQSAFTLIEVLVAMAIMAIIFVLVGPIAYNFYFDYEFDSEYSLLNSVLRYARNLSMVNHNESDHGLYITSSDFVVFQGASYATRDFAQDKPFPRNSAVAIAGPTELLFSALSGRTASTTYAVSFSGKSRDVYVNLEGLVYE